MATAAQRQAAADRGTPLEDLTEEEFSKLWMMGMSSERTLGRPREWNGKEEGFDTFAFKFANWLSGMPGNAEELLDKAAMETEPIQIERLDFKKRVMAKGVNQALRGLVEGKALDIVKSVEERGNGFEAWRRLWAEYRPQTAGRKVSLVEAVMEDRPKEGEDFSTWYYRWVELIRQTELARRKPLDDDIKCAVLLKRTPIELRSHLVLQAGVIADRFDMMNQVITTWMIARRTWPSHTASSTPTIPAARDPNAMEIGAMAYGGKGKGKSGKAKGKGKSGGKGKHSGYEQYGYGKNWYGKEQGGYGKGKAKGKGDKGWQGKGTWSSPPVELFPGYCGGCWAWGHKKAQCPQRAVKMDVGAVAAGTTASPSTSADVASSASAKVAAVRAQAQWEQQELWAHEEDWPEVSWQQDYEGDWYAQDWAGTPEHYEMQEWAEEPEEDLWVCSLRAQSRESDESIEELMIDSGSQSTACRVDFAPEYGIDDTDKARLWDIQDCEIPAYGKKLVDVKFVGEVGEDDIDASLKMDASNVARNVASMGRLTRAGFDLHFTNFGHTSWMERDGRRTTIYEDDPQSDAPLYSMRLKVRPTPGSEAREPDAAPLRVAPVRRTDELYEACEVELAGLTTHSALNGQRGRCVQKLESEPERWRVKLDTGRVINVKLDNIRRLDLPTAEVPSRDAESSARGPVALRSPGELPSRAVIESHNLAHLPYAAWCEICVAARGETDQHTPVEESKPIPQVQLDYAYYSATGDVCTMERAKATVIVMVDCDVNEYGLMQVKKKGYDTFAVRFTASFLDRLLAPVVRTRFDNEPALVQLVDKVAEFRMPRETLKEPIVRAEHEGVGAVERAHRSLQATTRALKLDYLARTKVDVVPGHVLFPWMLRHSAWLTNRFQPRGSRGTTAYEARNGVPYKSALVAFGEVIMIRVPIDPPGLKRKLDTQWMKGVWVGRMDDNDAHIVITPYGTVTGRTVRRLPAGQRHQPDLVRAVRAEVSDPVLSQAALLKALPVSVPIRLDGETELIETRVGESAMVEEQIVDEAATTAVQITAPDFMQIEPDLGGVGGAPGEVGGASAAPPFTVNRKILKAIMEEVLLRPGLAGARQLCGPRLAQRA